MKYSLGARIALILVTLAVVGVSVFIVINREGAEEKFNRNNTYTNRGLTVLENIDPEADSDNDNLKDWQEALWRTDPHNPDTDGDGTIDGQEVEEKRNPLKNNINDSLNLRDSEYSRSFTEQVAQNVYGQYAIIEQQGTALTEQVQGSIIENSLESSDLNLEIQLKTYSEIFVDPEYTNHREYAQKMGTILIENARQKEQSSVTAIVEQSLLEGNRDTLLKLNSHISRYESMIGQALKVRVPFALAENHLLFINGLESIRASIVALSNAPDDPLKGLAGLSVYSDAIETTSSIISEFQSFYETNDISFEQGSSGYVFLYGL